ncbi:Uncharacterised protein [Leclercia adecarboxylata]|uniref:Uncharacterized protein n=1 Tax=Leclercia adecarboxylata TaxID=83655 RepID=A0A4U9IUX4_9ENTR|nr:Uncharacterised protein [Leclercia adecarboxylata]
MSAVSLLDGFTDEARLFRSAVTHGMQQRERRFALIEIVTDIFAQRFAIGAVIEQVVDQLEGGAEIAPVILQATFLFLTAASKNARALGRRLKQTRRFAVRSPACSSLR